VERNPETEQIPGLLIFRPNGMLFFANANHVRNDLRKEVKKAGKALRAVVLNLETCPGMDVTSLEMLEQLWDELHDSDIDLFFVRVADPVRDLFGRSGFLELLGERRIFPGVDVAVSAFLETRPATHARSA
jgi:SulP family sulfate permease